MNRKLLSAIIISTYIFLLIAIFVLTLLALDVFTVPYLTPFAHFVKTLISPFVPLIMPFYLGAFLKVYKHEPFPSRKQWMFSTGCIIFQQVPRELKNMGSLYEFKRLGNGQGLFGLGLEAEVVCGLKECTSSWVEAALMVGVVVGEWMGWKWDAGYVQKWVKNVAEESIKKEREGKGEVEPEVESMEKGEVDGEDDVVDEKKATA
jgi:hypothetical protein